MPSKTAGASEVKAGLRIDVDTLRGTKKGVLSLLHILGEREIKASFFFSVGPDNMGRHLRRLLRLKFLFKMVRSRAVSLYGWDILLRGTFGEGAYIGRNCEEIIRSAAMAGHEIGLHAWDHYQWQSRIETMESEEIKEVVRRGIDELKRITGEMPIAFAAPAWRISREALEVLEEFPFLYRSDCRGISPFLPQITLAKREGEKGKERLQYCITPSAIPQIPATLPTYDEMVGRCCSKRAYNKEMLARFTPDKLNVLTIHAEAEGICCADIFVEFLDMALEKNITFLPLGKLLPAKKESIPVYTMTNEEIEGREGLVSMQGEKMV